MPVEASAAASAAHSRRAFCVRACQTISLAGAGIVLHACGGGSPTSPTPPAPALPVVGGSFANGTVSVPVGPGSPLAGIGSAALVQSAGGNFLVARTGDAAFTALTATCTHEACTITGRQGEAFVCPCHGSRFSSAGAVLNGPATRSLPQFTTQVTGEMLTIAV